jgi:hypothetical protein
LLREDETEIGEAANQIAFIKSGFSSMPGFPRTVRSKKREEADRNLKHGLAGRTDNLILTFIETLEN